MILGSYTCQGVEPPEPGGLAHFRRSVQSREWRGPSLDVIDVAHMCRTLHTTDLLPDPLRTSPRTRFPHPGCLFKRNTSHMVQQQGASCTRSACRSVCPLIRLRARARQAGSSQHSESQDPRPPATRLRGGPRLSNALSMRAHVNTQDTFLSVSHDARDRTTPPWSMEHSSSPELLLGTLCLWTPRWHPTHDTLPKVKPK